MNLYRVVTRREESVFDGAPGRTFVTKPELSQRVLANEVGVRDHGELTFVGRRTGSIQAVVASFAVNNWVSFNTEALNVTEFGENDAMAAGAWH